MGPQPIENPPVKTTIDTASQSPLGTSQSPKKRNWWKWVIIFIIVLLIIFFLPLPTYKQPTCKPGQLNCPKYLAWGPSLFDRFKDRLMPRVTEAPVTIPATDIPATTDETANWKTYGNYGVSFKYPSTWIEKPVVANNATLTQDIQSEEGPYKLTFSSQENYNQMTSKPFADLDEYIGMSYQVKVVDIAGREGRQPLPRAGSENMSSVNFFSTDSKSIYTLTLEIGDSPLRVTEAQIQEGQKLFDQILSTFKFL